MKTKIVFLLLIVIVLAGCSKRLTRQFILPDITKENPYEPVVVSGWSIEQPRLVAYKNLIDLSNVQNPHMFWLTLQASYLINNKESVKGNFNLDSVGIVTQVLDTLWGEVHSDVEFLETGSSKWIKVIAGPDSVGFVIQSIDTVWSNSIESFIPVTNTTWRKPSRVSEFDDNLGKYHIKVFNFFNDQGIEIPAVINNSTLIFTVKIMNDDKVVSEENIEFDLVRQEMSLKVPLIQQ